MANTKVNVQPLNGGRGRVLIVDDDVDVLAELGATFRRLGFAVSGASDLEQARQYTGSESHDLAVIDLNLGREDGLTFLEELAEAGGGAPAVLLLSGLDPAILRSAERTAREAGVTVLGGLSKPLRASHLRRVLDAIDPLQSKPDVDGKNSLVSVQAFREALGSGLIRPYFQPQVDLTSGERVGYEVLARWVEPDSGLVRPALEFMQFFDQPEFRWPVLRSIASAAIRAFATYCKPVGQSRLSLNVPVGLFAELDLPSYLMGLCDSCGVRPQQLVLELTETDHVPIARAHRTGVTRARINGFGLSLDDFGVGAASIDRLSSLPLTEAKLDKSFLWAAAKGDDQALRLMQDMAQMLHHRGLLTVVEGIENHAMLDLARGMGFQIGQGYLFGAAMPPEEAWGAEAVRAL